MMVFPALLGLGAGPQSIGRTDFEGWKQCWRLTNGVVEAIVAPQVGRIVCFRRVGGKNVLWIRPDDAGKVPSREFAETGGYLNLGGDKLWLSPQSRWNWPPPAALDGMPHQIRRNGNDLVMRSQPTAEGMVVERRVRMTPKTAQLMVDNQMINLGPKPVEWAIWQVAQIVPPTFVELRIRPISEHPQGWSAYPNLAPSKHAVRQGLGGVVRFARDKAAGYKIASSPRPLSLSAWYAQSKERLTLETLAPAPRGYPENEAAAQIYSSQDPERYMELEFTSPMARLAPGDSRSMTVVWTISP